MMNDRFLSLNLGRWELKMRLPHNIKEAPVFILLHGWTGDENSMWVFADKLNPDGFIISPRGLFPSNHPDFAGYSWVKDTTNKWATKKDFQYSADQLSNLLSDLETQFPADYGKINLVGFSQGSALAGEFLFTNPDKISRLAMLSGFLADGSQPSNIDLHGKQIFIGHGTQDETVPIGRAQQAELLFKASGAQVTSCFTDVGHRLGADCFRGFNRFFENS